jgi:hypothetical protein
MIRLTLAVLALALLPQDVDTKRHPWLKWKKGSFTRFKMNVDLGGQQLELGTRQELSAADDKEFTLAVTTEANGQAQESETVESVPKKDGQETLKIDGKEYTCTIWKSSRSRGGRDSEVRYWFADGADAAVKFTTKGEDEAEFVAVKLAEELTVAGKKLSCVKLEGTLKGRMGEMKGAFWFSPDVPGGAAKFGLEGEKGKFGAEVVEFEGKK